MVRAFPTVGMGGVPPPAENLLIPPLPPPPPKRVNPPLLNNNFQVIPNNINPIKTAFLAVVIAPAPFLF